VVVIGSGNNQGLITTSNGTIVFDGGLSAAPGAGQLQITQGGGALSSFIRQGTLTINGTIASPSVATIRDQQFGGDTSVINQLTLGGSANAWTGVLDLSDNDLVIDYAATSPRATNENQIRTARAGGAWTGNGITSTAARNHPQHITTLGLMEGTEFKSIYGPAALFSGQSIDTTSLLTKYTYYGDADFNGQVNFDDYSRIDAGFSTGRTGWINGDFDLSGVVNFDDYSLIDLAFNTQSGTLVRAMDYLEGEDRSDRGMGDPALRLVQQHFQQFGVVYATSFLNAVPEPGCAWVALSGLCVCGRRRRR